MKIEIRHSCESFKSYRAARVKSLFNCEDGHNFSLDADLPLDSEWKLGVIVGPSGSGKTSLGKHVLNCGVHTGFDWPSEAPIIDAIAPNGDFNEVTGCLSAVGLGSVPAWLRPFSVLSNGEKFRADLARVLAEAPNEIVIDEFTSVVDRQIAKFGALAFAKAWKRTNGKCVLLSCHYDILDWLEPDWVFDTATGKWSGRSLWRRPSFELKIHETDWRFWPMFEPHHYLKLPRMVAARCYVGTVEGMPVCHVAVGCKNKGKEAEARACRLVVMPEWQGAGVGTRFLDAVAQLQLEGKGRLKGRNVTTIFHTSHPGLAMALRRSKKWRQLSGSLVGANKAKSKASITKSSLLKTGEKGISAGYGGHFRAVQGFRYGER